MTSEITHTIVAGLLAFAGLSALAFALMRGRKVGAGVAFGLGGVGLIVYAGLFFITQKVARMDEMIRLSEKLGGANEQTGTAKAILSLVNPNAVIEPIAILLLALGIGALARAADARSGADHAAGAEAGSGLGGDESDGNEDRAGAETLDEELEG